MVETEASEAATPHIEDWTQTPWRKLERQVYRLQKRIYKAQTRGNVKAVHSLQRLLMKSKAARTLAVRRVTQDNQGKKTAGIDGVKAVGPLVRLLFVAQLRTPGAITARPVRRVLIPKAGKKDEFRPLGIPVMLDRAHQSLVKLSLEPQWEARFEPNSYGFRPGRSCHDAIEAIYLGLRAQDKYILDADIKGCFDNIDHQALLNKLDTTPAIRRAVKAWLAAGVMKDGVFTPTTSGTPQGGCISPVLANIALHGLEEAAVQSYQRWSSTRNRVQPKLLRYADDFVILCQDMEGIVAAKVAVEVFLHGMGLHLSPTKTRITHTLQPPEGAAGFDFLGFTIRHYPVGKTHAGKQSNGTRSALTLRITPSKEAVKRHIAMMGRVVRTHATAPQEQLIDRLNPRTRGWSGYYRTVVSSAAFRHCDNHLYAQLRRWARRRHPRKPIRWIVRRYWRMQPEDRWSFVVRQDGKTSARLRRHTETSINRHVKVRERATPFDGNLLYWARRLKAHPLTSTTLGRLLRVQQGKCAHCGLTFTQSDLLETDHTQPTTQGGTEALGNKQVLHRHCHDQKTARDRRPLGIADNRPQY